MLLLKSGILLPMIIIPVIAVLLSQILICRFAKKPFTCMWPFIIILCMCCSVFIFVASGMMSDIYEGILTLFILEAITASIVADIVGWILGLFWRGYHIVRVRESTEININLETDTCGNIVESKE